MATATGTMSRATDGRDGVGLDDGDRQRDEQQDRTENSEAAASQANVRIRSWSARWNAFPAFRAGPMSVSISAMIVADPVVMAAFRNNAASRMDARSCLASTSLY